MSDGKLVTSLVIPVAAIEAIVERLDVNDAEMNIGREHGLTLRMFKILEERGETVAARIGMLGQNPRKGICMTRENLVSEMFDTALTALVAAASFDPRWAERFIEHFERVTARTVAS